IPSTCEELDDVYAPHTQGNWPTKVTIIDNSSPKPVINQLSAEKRFIDAIKEGLWQSMQQHSNLILMGQDIAEYGGAFKITEGFVHEFSKDRVRNSPLCERAI